MEKGAQLYEGKAKKVFATENPELLIVSYKDDATAFNGLKHGTIAGKGVINNKMSNALMRYLEARGIPTHYVEELSDRDTLVKKVEIVPLEVIIRNISAGSFAKRYGVEEGIVFASPTIEFSYKNDDLDDPLINDCHALALKLATHEELDDIIHVLDEANRIFVYASGDIETEVRSFNNRMSMMSVEPIMINDDADQQKLIASIQEDDVVIIVSSLADNETYDKTIEFIYETNALKILITTYEDPNKRFQPDYAFYTYPNGNEFIRNSVSISQMSLLLGMNIIQTCPLKLRSEKRG